MEDINLFSDHEYPMDSFAFQFDDMAYFKSFSASPQESTYSSHNNNNNNNNKRIHSESTQNSSFPTQSSPDQSVASATPPTKLLKASPKIISFDYSNNDSKVKKPKTEIGYGENLNFGTVISQGDYDKRENKVATINRNPMQARDHVIAERKRREKLSQRFIALSSILPGLKKVLYNIYCINIMHMNLCSYVAIFNIEKNYIQIRLMQTAIQNHDILYQVYKY